MKETFMNLEFKHFPEKMLVNNGYKLLLIVTGLTGEEEIELLLSLIKQMFILGKTETIITFNQLKRRYGVGNRFRFRKRRDVHRIDNCVSFRPVC